MNTIHDTSKFPGYPHYPAAEDITRAKNNNGREQVEDATPLAQAGTAINSNDISDDDYDVNNEEVRLLDATDQDMDTVDDINIQHASLDRTDGDGDLLNEESGDIDLTGEDLDVPGSSDDDRDELIGEEDEENNYYSLGGDGHEAQEESKE